MDIDLNKFLGGKIKILGQEINLGDVDQLKELRGKLKESGASELLSDTEWKNQQSSIRRGGPRSLSEIGGIIPNSAGLTRGARPSPRPSSRSSVSHTIGRKPSESPPKFTVESDKLIDEEFQIVPGLTSVFTECMKLFPELDEIECRATRCTELSGAKGTLGGKQVIILFVPDEAWGKWNALKPIILHELAHCIDSDNPNQVFEARADEQSKQLWHKLNEFGQIRCSKDNYE